MKYDFDQALTGLDGKELRLMTSMKLDEDGQPETSPLTLGLACTEALMNAVPDDEKELTKEAFMKRFRLAQRISAGGKNTERLRNAALACNTTWEFFFVFTASLFSLFIDFSTSTKAFTALSLHNAT